MMVYEFVTRLIGQTRKFVELSKWFNQKSQHYVLGNWLCCAGNWDYEKGTWSAKYFRYLKEYPRAWCKFMWYSRHDIYGA
jgi:hypothetical protein